VTAVSAVTAVTAVTRPLGIDPPRPQRPRTATDADAGAPGPRRSERPLSGPDRLGRDTGLGRTAGLGRDAAGRGTWIPDRQRDADDPDRRVFLREPSRHSTGRRAGITVHITAS
jgi:hypothetical protein